MKFIINNPGVKFSDNYKPKIYDILQKMGIFFLIW